MTEQELRLEAQDLNQQGATLLKAGSVDAAREKFDKAIDLDPMLVDNYRNYGDLYMATNEYKQAKDMYKKALLIEKDGALYFLYGNACFMDDDVHEGLEYYNMAISAGYDGDEMLFFMGMAYEHLNDDHMALRYFQKACLKNPSRPDYLVKKITTLARLNLLDSAEESVDTLLKNSPELYDGYHLKTQLLINRKALDEAVEFSRAASARFPEDASLMYDYAKTVALNKDFATANQLLENARRMKYFEESKRNFVLLEAQIAAESNDFDKAVALCQECIALEADGFFDSEARFMLMNLYLSGPNYEKAMGEATEIVAEDKEDLYYFAALYYKPFCLRQLGRTEEAAGLYKEANAIYRLETLKNPAALDVCLYRVMCLKDMGESDKALELLDFINELSNEIAEVYTLRADIYRATGKDAQAEAELEKAYQIKPELREVYVTATEQS